MSFRPTRSVAYACLALSMALVGSYVALSKPLVAALPVFLLAWLRFGLGALPMLPWLRKPASEPPMTPAIRRLVFLESLLGNFLFSICMLYGVSMTSAVSAGVIMAAIPACVALMSWAFLRERIGLRVWGAVACAAIGIGLLALSKSEHSMTSGRGLTGDLAENRAWLGNLLVLGAVLCEAAYAVIGKKLTGALGPKRISALINLWGFALMTPLGLWMAVGFDFGAVHTGIWLLLVFYSLAASMFATWLWLTGLKTVPASHSGVFTIALPLAAGLVGVVWLGEHFTVVHAFSFACAAAGIGLTAWPAGTQTAHR